MISSRTRTSWKLSFLLEVTIMPQTNAIYNLAAVEASTEQVPVVGYTVLWRLHGLRVKHDQLKDALDHAGFLEFLPDSPTPRKSLRRALQAWVVARARAAHAQQVIAQQTSPDETQRTLIRVINRAGSEHIVFALVMEDVDYRALGLNYATDLRIQLHKKTGQMICTTQTTGRIESYHESQQVAAELQPYWREFKDLTSRTRERFPDPDRHVLARAPPRADDLALDEDGARPDPRRPEVPAMFGVGNEELPVSSLEQEVRIAAWKEPGWRRRPRVCVVRRLVAAKDPSVSKWRPDRRQRPVEGVERSDAFSRRDARPSGERVGRRGTEDVQVTASKFKPGVPRLDLGLRHSPDSRRPGAFPAHHDPAGQCGISEPVVVFAERPPRLAIGHPAAIEERVEAVSQGLGNPPHAGAVRQPPEREDGKVTSRNDIRVVSRSPELDERLGLQTGCPDSLDARMDREERCSGHAVLQTCPRRPLQRTRPGGELLVESGDAPSERGDLRPSNDQTGTGHVRPRGLSIRMAVIGVSPLLRSKCSHRVHLRRPLRRDVTRQQRNGGKQQRNHPKRHWISRAQAKQKTLQQLRHRQ